MAQKIKQGNIFGRIGSGIGKGLAEQLPKEIERGRLASGLQEISNRKGQSPFQQFSSLASLPGVTPQMIQSGSELLRQQGVGQALMDKAGQPVETASVNPFPQAPTQSGGQAGLSPTLTTRGPIDATLTPYIPRTLEQNQQRAGQLYAENPALYGNNPQLALEAAVMEDNQNQKINAAQQQQRLNQQEVQGNVTKGLKNQQAALGAKLVPGGVYSDIEDKAINAVLPIDQGGEGLTEQEAQKKYGKELDKVSRDYKGLETLDGWSVLGRSPKENLRSIKTLRNDFKERNDLENFADTLISNSQLSPGKAYYLAYPPSDNKELNNAIVKLPKISTSKLVRDNPDLRFDQIDEMIKNDTLKASENLAKAMGKEGSPLAIAEELAARNYDPDIWLDYLNKNRKQLDLTERQGRELSKPRNRFPTMNDNWLFIFSGLDKLVEQ